MGDLLTIPRECIESDGDGIIIELGEYNAPRACKVCGEDGDFYLYCEGVIATGICAEHFREAPVKPASEIGGA